MTDPEKLRALADLLHDCRRELPSDLNDMQTCEDLRRIADRLDQRKVDPRDWLLIETAPQDGSEILATDGEVIRVVACLNNNVRRRGRKMMAWCVCDSWQDEQGGYETISPTHWMPLPAKP